MHDTRPMILYCTSDGAMRLTGDPRALESGDTVICNGEAWAMLRLMHTGMGDGRGVYIIPQFHEAKPSERQLRADRFLTEARLMIDSGELAPRGARLHSAAVLLLAVLICRPVLALDHIEGQPDALPGARAMLATCETVTNTDSRAGTADLAACLQRILPSLTSRQIEALGRAGYFGVWAEQLAAEQPG